MKVIVFAIFLAICAPALAQTPTGEEILDRIDENMSSRNRVVTSQMVIHGRRSTRTIASRSWVQGTEKSFTEYLSPARERGTKMLKLADNLWVFSPSSDRTIQISGHMLRQSVMGSDLSFEDMLEDPKLTHHYHAAVVGEEIVDDNACWVLELTAKVRDIAYYMRKIWVDREKSIPLREELYAKGGKLLKRMALKDIALLEDRWYPKRMIYRDMLKKGKGTEFIIETIEFDVDIPPHIFTKAALKK
ncbi:MAG: outer membrane lipoprotein-sorting protein [Deltaproteobacteria bacterium]|nr:outer membrane lipoprotein-sorting protein [Deltaproteobacteria bacterium]